jgi:hypothetical protein
MSPENFCRVLQISPKHFKFFVSRAVMLLGTMSVGPMARPRGAHTPAAPATRHWVVGRRTSPPFPLHVVAPYHAPYRDSVASTRTKHRHHHAPGYKSHVDPLPREHRGHHAAIDASSMSPILQSFSQPPKASNPSPRPPWSSLHRLFAIPSQRFAGITTPAATVTWLRLTRPPEYPLPSNPWPTDPRWVESHMWVTCLPARALPRRWWAQSPRQG